MGQIDLQRFVQEIPNTPRQSDDNGRELNPSRVQNVPKWCQICSKMSQNLPLESKGVQRGFGVAKRLKKVILYAPFWRSFWHVLGYSLAGLFGPRLLELPRAALGPPGKPQEPFRFHVGCIFGAILGPESKKGEKVNIELSPRRELNFHFFALLRFWT